MPAGPARSSCYQDAEQRMIDDGVWVSLYHYASRRSIRPTVKDLERRRSPRPPSSSPPCARSARPGSVWRHCPGFGGGVAMSGPPHMKEKTAAQAARASAPARPQCFSTSSSPRRSASSPCCRSRSVSPCSSSRSARSPSAILPGPAGPARRSGAGPADPPGLRAGPARARPVRAWMGRLVRGDLGTSHHQQRPVAEILAERLPATARLALAAT